MTARLRHPVTGAEFDAPDSAVSQYARSGWVVAGELVAAGEQDTPIITSKQPAKPAAEENS